MHFDRFAGDYRQVLDRSIALSGEDSGYFAEYKARYLHRLLSPDFAGKALDFGCGIGLLSGFLKKHLGAIQFDGYDVSHDSVRKVDASLTAQGTFTCDAAQLARDYNLIVVANVMHHIPPSQRAEVVRDLAARLQPGGILAVFEHNPANPVTRWVVERCPFDDDAVLLAPREMLSYVAQAKLTPKRRDYIVFLPHFLAALRPIEFCLSWLPLGAQYAVLAEKP